MSGVRHIIFQPFYFSKLYSVLLISRQMKFVVDSSRIAYVKPLK